jgi:hypothetical protein
MKRLKSSTRQGRTAVRRRRVTNKYASEDNSPSVSVLGKRRHGSNDNNDDNDDNGRIFDSVDNEGDFGEDVEGDHSQESEGDEDPAVDELARHFREARGGGLPLALDLAAIQLPDQYRNAEYGPESSVQQQVDIPVDSRDRTARPVTRGGSSGGRGARGTAPSVQEQVLGTSGPLDDDRRQHHSSHQRSSGPPASDISALSDASDPSEDKLREFDQQVRLTTFRWHSNKFASEVIRQVYGSDLKETDPTWQSSRVKLFDNVRTQKNRMLARLEDHLKATRQKCPQQWALGDDDFRADRFEVLNASTFQHIWYYLEGRVDFDRSEDLGRYFIRTIYANLCVVCRDWMNTPADQLGKSDKRQVLLAVYDAAPLAEEFSEVDWDDFKIIDKEVKKKKSKVSVKDVLVRSFKAVAPPP